MLDLTSAKAGRLLSVTETDIEQRKATTGQGDEGIPRITSLKSMIERRADHYTEVSFNHLVQGRRRPRTLCSVRRPRPRPSSASASVHAGGFVVDAGEGRGAASA
jgi:hypothetical protein